MKEINKIISFYEQKKQEGFRCALAMVVHVSGSSYRQVGARMLIVENGEWEGGISGGCLEGDVLIKAKAAIVNQKSNIITYDTTQNDKDQIGVGLGCEGVIDILIIPIHPKVEQNCISVLKNCHKHRKPHILLTILEDKQALQLYAGDTFYYEEEQTPKILGENTLLNTYIAAVYQNKKSKIVRLALNENENINLLIEYIAPPIHLFIFGSHYDIYPLIELAHVLGWQTSLTANLLKLDKRKLHLVTHTYHNKTSVFPKNIDERSAIILMTHDYKTDARLLKYSLQTQAAYIGILGPKKRGNKLLRELENTGIQLTENQQNQLHNPIGLDIGGISPEEIALSIVAEIQAVFAQREGGFLRVREGRIHEELTINK